MTLLELFGTFLALFSASQRGKRAARTGVEPEHIYFRYREHISPLCTYICARYEPAIFQGSRGVP